MGKRSKQFYAAGGGKKRKYLQETPLATGSKGFLLTYIRGRDRQAKSETFELISAYLPRSDEVGSDTEGSENSDSSEDIEAALKREVKHLKKGRPTKIIKFQDTGVNHTLFAKCAIQEPEHVAYDILGDALSGSLKVATKTLLRFLPVQMTCRAELDAITKSLMPCLEECLSHHFNTTEGQLASVPKFTYKVDFKRKYNDDKSLVKADVYERVGLIMSEKYPGSKVRLNDPDLIVILDIMKRVCCVSIVKDFSKYKKFNLQELDLKFHMDKSLATSDLNPATSRDQTTPDKVQTSDLNPATNAINSRDQTTPDKVQTSGGLKTDAVELFAESNGNLNTDSVNVDVVTASTTPKIND